MMATVGVQRAARRSVRIYTCGASAYPLPACLSKWLCRALLCPRRALCRPFAAFSSRCSRRGGRAWCSIRCAATGAASEPHLGRLPRPALGFLIRRGKRALGRRSSCAKLALNFGVPSGGCAAALRRRSAKLPGQFAGQPSERFGLPLSPPQPPQAIVVFFCRARNF